MYFPIPANYSITNNPNNCNLQNKPTVKNKFLEYTNYNAGSNNDKKLLTTKSLECEDFFTGKDDRNQQTTNYGNKRESNGYRYNERHNTIQNVDNGYGSNSNITIQKLQDTIFKKN